MSGVPTPSNPMSEAWAINAGSGFINIIPLVPAANSPPELASFDQGFPGVCFLPLTQGGIPFRGADVNGILNAISQYCVSLQAGQLMTYNANISTAIGGYAEGAVLRKADFSGLWISTVDANTTNPDTGGAGWQTLGSLFPCTVAQLPAAGSTPQGTRGFVTDANSTTFNAAAVGSSTNPVPVFNTGAAWHIG